MFFFVFSVFRFFVFEEVLGLNLVFVVFSYMIFLVFGNYVGRVKGIIFMWFLFRDGCVFLWCILYDFLIFFLDKGLAISIFSF